MGLLSRPLWNTTPGGQKLEQQTNQAINNVVNKGNNGSSGVGPTKVNSPGGWWNQGGGGGGVGSAQTSGQPVGSMMLNVPEEQPMFAAISSFLGDVGDALSQRNEASMSNASNPRSELAGIETTNKKDRVKQFGDSADEYQAAKSGDSGSLTSPLTSFGVLDKGEAANAELAKVKELAEQNEKAAEADALGLGDFSSDWDAYSKKYLDGMGAAEFSLNGTADQWYDMVMDDTMRQYYKEYEDEYGSFDDRANFDSYYNASKLLGLGDAYSTSDASLLERIFGSDEQIWDAMNNYLTTDPEYSFYLMDAEGNPSAEILAQNQGKWGTSPSQKDMLNYVALGMAARNNLGSLTPSMANYLTENMPGEGMEFGYVGGDYQQDRTNGSSVDPMTFDANAYYEWGVPYAGLPDLFQGTDIGYRSRG